MYHEEPKHRWHTYTTILFLNSGQSSVNVSYSPPSPQTFRPNFSFFMQFTRKTKHTQQQREASNLIQLKIHQSQPKIYTLF